MSEVFRQTLQVCRKPYPSDPMRLLISFAALFLSVILLQLSSGGVGPLDALSGLHLGFTNTQIGLLGSAHFIGFFLGCWLAPRLMGRIGHSRSFAAFTAMGAIGLLAHMLIIDPLAWAGMRVASGICIAGSYTVIEAWLQAKLANESRGRAMGIYRAVDMGASLAAQLLIGVLAPAHYVSYNLLALLCCAAILPLTLTRAVQPETPQAPRLKPLMALQKSPLGAAAVVVAGLTTAAFRMIGPVYGQQVGLSADQIGYFLALFVAGGALAQYPAGWLADKYDRRWVLIGLSLLATLACGLMVPSSGGGAMMIFAAVLVFGFVTFPIYSVAAAHAHDFASSAERVELSASLMFLYALGAISSPLLASRLIDLYGPEALFYMISVGHVLLAVIGAARMQVRPTVAAKTGYVYAPRTSFIMGRWLSRKR